MQMSITFRNFEASDSLKDYANEKVERASKYLDRAGEAHVVLSLERHLHHADITLHSGPFVLRGKDKSDDMYTSIDLAMDKIERQLERYKDRMKSHRGKEREHHAQATLESLKVRHNVVEVPGPEEGAVGDIPRVIRTDEMNANEMTVHDAVMHMDLMDEDYFVFRNAESDVVNVVYRRKDGNFGLIEAPSSASAA